ncbi:small lysine-rich protein 1 [Diretmus argenteus]
MFFGRTSTMLSDEKPTRSRRSRSHSSARPAKSAGKPRSSKKRASSSAKSTERDVDILSPAAMENLYYISHSAVDALTFRGFGWPKKKGKKSKKRKKKSRL